jgi:hypothetical protein
MAHPHQEHRDHKVSERRLHSLYGHMPHRASGGSVEHSDEREDKALVKSMVKGASLKAAGGKVKARADRPCRARGGKVKKAKGHTSVNVIVAPQGGGMPPGPPPMAMKPPMPAGPPPGAPPPGAPPMMPHKAGGRAYKKGGRVKRAWGGAMPFGGMSPAMAAPGATGAPVMSGVGMGAPSPMMNNGAGAPMTGAPMPRQFAKGGAVKSGNTWEEGVKNGTRPQHNESGKTANQKDQPGQLNRGKVVTYRTGGAVEHPKKGGMAPHLPSGSGGGEARLAKRKLAFGKPAKEVNGAR